MRHAIYLLLFVLGLATQASAAPQIVQAGGGELLVEPKHDLLGALGVRLARPAEEELRLQLDTGYPLSLELGDGGPTELLGGRLLVPRLVLLRKDGQRSPPLALVPAPDRALGLDVVDASGAAWLRIGQAMRSPSLDKGFRLITADLRVGPALAAWSGTDSEGLLAGRVELAAPLLLPDAAAKAEHTCQNQPVAWSWPTLGYTVDVRLVNIDQVTSLRCRVQGSGAGCGFNAFSCDGPGGSEGEVVFVPDATLRNSDADDTADVPWFRKFSGEFEPYGNDQHPYLVWNLYRLDADGGLLQIARSGLKHAFATANTGCSPLATCRYNSQVLGRGCGDLYDAASNDTTSALAPRSEIVPATGTWGRCGSVFDDMVNLSGEPGCDGEPDPAPANDCYRYRMVALESAIDPAANPGARWFIEAWYVVRDDVDIFNNMGFREITPTWLAAAIPPRWSPGVPGAFQQGSILEFWHQQAEAPAQSERRLVQTADGMLELATRVEPVTGGYRYRYTVLNRDWTRQQTAGDEPNLQIQAQHGFRAMRLAAGGSSVAKAVAAADPARSGEQWLALTGCGGPSIAAPAGVADLHWGELMRFELTSAHPPVAGELRLEPGDGSPAIAVQAPVPDAGVVFCDSFSD